MIDDLWYKNAVIYSVDVETFMDGNGDGVGDFKGLRRRLEYLAELGVTCIWLLPFYPTPNRDNGYDVVDYYSVDPRLGDLGDFVSFSHEAKMHGMRIIIDLVVNHTSNEHPWFKSARSDPNSRFRDFYVWSKEKPADADTGMVFPGDQKSTWTYDEAAGLYYFHRFYEFQPDLNIENPAVREEILKIVGFWLELGVSGFRVDAVPFLIEPPKHSKQREPLHHFLTQLRDFLSWRRGDAVLLAEANIPMKELEVYFAEGQRLQLAFNFILNQALFLAMVDHDATPVVEALGKTLRMEAQAQWANFLRNHDELDLARLTDKERKRAFASLGPDPDMQLYGRGLRRRLAPMLQGHPARIALAYSLLLTLPGTPVFWYGEEIGMGELLELEGRHSVRTPMQWSGERNAGFSSGTSLVRPVVEQGPYAYSQVNAAAQRHHPQSQLNVIKQLIWRRRDCAEIGWGHWEVLKTHSKEVLALQYTWKGSVVIVVHNFAPDACDVQIPSQGSSGAYDILSGGTLKPQNDKLSLQLAPYGYCWMRLSGRDRMYENVADGEI